MSFLDPQALWLFAFVLCRVAGLVLLAPVFVSMAAPWRWRVLLTLVLAWMIFPVQWRMPAAEWRGDVVPVELMIGELIVGLSLGLTVGLFLCAAQLAGGVVSQLGGVSMVEAFQPGGAGEPALARFFYLFAAAVFFTTGGHRLVVGGLLESFAALPPGGGIASSSVIETATTLLSQSFMLALRLAVPVATALLLTSLAMGLIGRALAPFNAFAAGMAAQTMAALAVLAVSLGVLAWTLEERLEPMLSETLAILSGS